MRTLEQFSPAEALDRSSTGAVLATVPAAKILVFAQRWAEAEQIRGMLAQAGYNMVVARTVAAALAALREAAPDLAVLVLSRAEAVSDVLCYTIKHSAATWHLPVVGVAATAGRRAAHGDFDEVLTGPFDGRELAICVRVLLRSRRSMGRLERAEHVMLALARAVEAKDGYTEGHLQRLADYTDAISGQMGLGDADRSLLRYGALLHDIGKIGVDERVLRKAGPLSPAEYQHMQQHVLVGEQIVQPLRLGAAVRPIIRHHHERWDGRGYPDRLAGTAIPLGARVIAVADAFDAMTTQRPYNRPLSFAAATERISAGAGSYWDPQVAELFVGWLRAQSQELPCQAPALEREVGA